MTKKNLRMQTSTQEFPICKKTRKSYFRIIEWFQQQENQASAYLVPVSCASALEAQDNLVPCRIFAGASMLSIAEPDIRIGFRIFRPAG
jgi:hypothetical protein